MQNIDLSENIFDCEYRQSGGKWGKYKVGQIIEKTSLVSEKNPKELS